MKCYGCLKKGIYRERVVRLADGHTYCFECAGLCDCGWWPRSQCGEPCPGEQKAESSRLTGLDAHQGGGTSL